MYHASMKNFHIASYDIRNPVIKHNQKKGKKILNLKKYIKIFSTYLASRKYINKKVLN